MEWLNQGPMASVVRVLVFFNALVFLNWQFLFFNNFHFMEQHFLVSWTGVLEGRIWTLITSVFSHNLFLHFMLNMFVLTNFGPVLEKILGSKRFFCFYLVAGVLSSLAHSLVSAFLIGEPDTPALGASGAISGLVLLFSLIFPRQKLLLLGFVPVPAIFGAFIFIGLDLWGLFEQTQGSGFPIGHGAHLGGAFTGIFYFFLFLKTKNS
jgi:membrane associated rhomboid family serine protease